MCVRVCIYCLLCCMQVALAKCKKYPFNDLELTRKRLFNPLINDNDILYITSFDFALPLAIIKKYQTCM